MSVLNVVTYTATVILKKTRTKGPMEDLMGGDIRNLTTEEVKIYLDTHNVDAYNLVDVRQDWEYEEFHLPGAKLIPLPELADRMGEIPHHKPTLVYCAVGGRSASAASLISGQGAAEVYNMLGGIMAWENEYAVGPQSLGMMYFSGDESPIEILRIAYEMEDNLGGFYSEMTQTKKPELIDVFTRLLKFEKGHKAKIFNLACGLDPSIESHEDMKQTPSVPALEGGVTQQEFIETNTAYLETPKGALEAAMMFEAQALDLYMRFALKAEGNESAELLRTLAQEEKSHLKLLGKLMVRDIVEND